MSDINVVSITGRIGKDPQVRKTPNGISVCYFRVANQRTTGAGENARKTVSWISCTAWRGTADFMGMYVKKGDQLAIQGHINVNQKETDGNKTDITEVVVDNLQLMSGRKPKTESTHNSQEQPYGGQDTYDEPLQFEDDELPF